MRRGKLNAFTLIEVLVVVAIIALLVAILLPSLSSARAQSRNAVCKSNLHQFGISIMLYAASNKDFIPRGGEVQNYFGTDVYWITGAMRQVGMDFPSLVRKANQAGSGMSTFRDGKTYQARGIALNDLIWEKLKSLPLFHCPERSSVSAEPEVLSYIVNAFDPQAFKKNSYTDVGTPTRASAWKQAGKVVYLTEVEHTGVSTEVSRSLYGYRDLARFDVFEKGHLPSSSKTTRRIARGMHLKRWTNALMVDGHAEGIISLPMAGEPDIDTTGNYSKRWLRHMGVVVP